MVSCLMHGRYITIKPRAKNLFLDGTMHKPGDASISFLIRPSVIEYLHYPESHGNQRIKKTCRKVFFADNSKACIIQQLQKGRTSAKIVDASDDVMTALSKAEVVQELMDQGKTFSEALRELGRRIRDVYGK